MQALRTLSTIVLSLPLDPNRVNECLKGRLASPGSGSSVAVALRTSRAPPSPPRASPPPASPMVLRFGGGRQRGALRSTAAQVATMSAVDAPHSVELTSHSTCSMAFHGAREGHRQFNQKKGQPEQKSTRWLEKDSVLEGASPVRTQVFAPLAVPGVFCFCPIDSRTKTNVPNLQHAEVCCGSRAQSYHLWICLFSPSYPLVFSSLPHAASTLAQLHFQNPMPRRHILHICQSTDACLHRSCRHADGDVRHRGSATT